MYAERFSDTGIRLYITKIRDADEGLYYCKAVLSDGQEHVEETRMFLVGMLSESISRFFFCMTSEFINSLLLFGMMSDAINRLLVGMTSDAINRFFVSITSDSINKFIVGMTSYSIKRMKHILEEFIQH